MFRKNNTTIKKWLPSILYVILIFSTIPLFPQLWKFLKLNLNFNPEYIIYLFLLLSLIFVSYITLRKKRKDLFFFVSLLFSFINYTILLFFICKFPADRLHLVEYGFLAFFLFYSYSDKKENVLHIYLYILLTGLFIGLMDEIIQYFTPERYFETKDIIINFISLLLGSFIIAVYRWENYIKLSKQKIFKSYAKNIILILICFQIIFLIVKIL